MDTTGGNTSQQIDFSKLNAAQLGHNYLQKQNGGEYHLDDLNLLNGYLNYVLDEKNRDLKKYKVGVMLVCINQNYWQYMQPVIEDLKKFFLPGHDTEIMVWTDLPEPTDTEYFAKMETEMLAANSSVANAEPQVKANIEATKENVKMLRNLGVTFFPVESAPWPYPTLMRYHFFLKEEEYLKKFDYLFYIDLDMRIVNVVGDEILGNGLTMAQHPMYALRQEFWTPYEPNPKSSAYIKQPGRIIEKDGKKMFQPLYAAGGVQGGTTETFIPAMEAMKKLIDDDFTKNYVARWNDESHWNRYLFDHPPAVVLNPSYVYPDSMIQEYYIKLWGRDYPPKIITITKKDSLSKEGGAAAQRMMQTL